MLDKFYTAMLVIAFVLLVIAFEGKSAEVRKLEESNNTIDYSDNADLQCCPLCGSGYVDFVYGLTNIQVYCKECNLTTGYYASYTEAKDAWNRLRASKDN